MIIYIFIYVKRILLKTIEMENTKLRLPLSRVKKVFKTDSANNISADAAKLLTLATEKYVEVLSKCAWNWTLASARKTIQLADIEQCIKRDWMFAILEDALADWPDDLKATATAEDGEGAEDGADYNIEEALLEEIVEKAVLESEEIAKNIVREIENVEEEDMEQGLADGDVYEEEEEEQELFLVSTSTFMASTSNALPAVKDIEDF